MYSTEYFYLQDTINALTNQNSLMQSQMSNSENGNINGNQGESSDLVTSMNASIRQLEMERNEVVTQLRDEQSRADGAQSKLQQLQNELAHQSKSLEVLSVQYVNYDTQNPHFNPETRGSYICC